MSEVKTEKHWQWDEEQGCVVTVEREVVVRGFGAMKPIGKAAPYVMPRLPEADDLDIEPVYGKGPPDAA